MHWCSTLLREVPLEIAVAQACDRVRETFPDGDPDLLFLFVSGYAPEALEHLPGHFQNDFTRTLIMGCTAGGVVGEGREVERERALSLTAAGLPGIKLNPFHVDGEQALNFQNHPELLTRTLSVAPESSPDFILLADSFSFDPAPFLKTLDESFPGSTKVGGLASGGGAPGGNRLILGDRSFQTGLIGLALSGDVALDSLVAQGCRPIGNPMFITGGEGHLLRELDGKPVLEVLGELYGQLPPEDRELFQHSLFLGIAMRGQQQEYHAGDFLIRNLAGVLEEEGALAVGAHLHEGMVVHFHLRDKVTSAQDLEAMCRRYQMAHGAEHQAPEGALLFSCLGRGIHLYGVPDHDSKLLQKFFGPIPIGGFFCNGEIGPVHHQTFLHGYTSSVALFRRK